MDRAESPRRGREQVASSGRGGLGNIKSLSRDARSTSRSVPGPDDFSATRGREMGVNDSVVHSTGRGGAGNIRSPSGSRDVRSAAATPDAKKQQEIIAEYEQKNINVPTSFGRGGLGNMSRSRSRDQTSTLSSNNQEHHHHHLFGHHEHPATPPVDTIQEESRTSGGA